MSSELAFDGELPLRLPLKACSALESYPGLLERRNRCIAAIGQDTGRSGDWLGRIDELLGYAGALLSIDDELEVELSVEVAIAILDAAAFEQELALEVLERAYGSDVADAGWGTSGRCLRRGLGLVQYVELRFEQCLPRLCGLTTQLALEFQFLQQAGIVVLSLSKLRSKVHKGRREAVLDFYEQDLSELASNSGLYARLVIGCHDTALRCSRSSSIINKPVLIYLDSLGLLLVSLEQYSNDASGVALGMIQLAISRLNKIVPSSQLNDSILTKKKKRDFLKNAISTKSRKWTRKKVELLPVLQETLDDFVIPLALLLRYRFTQTNEKLSYQPIETDENVLRKLIPRGKAPELKGSQWYLNLDEQSLQQETPSQGAYF